MEKISVQVKSSKEEKRNSPVISVLKGAIMAVFISLVGILIFAFIIKFTGIKTAVIKPINQVIKGLSILVAVIIVLKKDNKLGFVKGAVIGALYTVLAFFVFSILYGGFSFNFTFFTDILFGIVMGAISGVIAVNIAKK